MNEISKKNIYISIAITILLIGSFLYLYFSNSFGGQSLNDIQLVGPKDGSGESTSMVIESISNSYNFPVKDFSFNLGEIVQKKIIIIGSDSLERDERFFEFIDSLNIKLKNCIKEIPNSDKLQMQPRDSMQLHFSYNNGKVSYYPIVSLSFFSKSENKSVYIISFDQVKINGVIGSNVDLKIVMQSFKSVCVNFVKVYDCLFTQ